jgi:hypothetical protein
MLPYAGAGKMEIPARLSMSTVNVERVGPAISPEKKLSTTTLPESHFRS